jgi:hypothetical protein
MRNHAKHIEDGGNWCNALPPEDKIEFQGQFNKTTLAPLHSFLIVSHFKTQK